MEMLSSLSLEKIEDNTENIIMHTPGCIIILEQKKGIWRIVKSDDFYTFPVYAELTENKKNMMIKLGYKHKTD